MIVGLLGLQRALTGHLVEGVALLARATSLAEQRGELYNLAPLQVLARRGASRLRRPGAGEAVRRRRASRWRAPSPSAGPRRGRGGFSVRSPRQTDPPGVQEAETAYREALTRASDLGMRPLVAHCHLGLGKLYRRTGDGAKAQEHLTTATTMYREMGMGFWLEKAEAELTERG